MNEKLFEVGKIINTHGVHGEVKVQRITDFEKRFAVGERLFVKNTDGSLLELEIDSHRKHKQFELLHFIGFNQLSDIEPYKGSLLKIKENQLFLLEEGKYYHHEIIGCKVHTTTNEIIGKITSIMETGANDVWEVESDDGAEILIPFIKSVVKKIDINAKKVVIEPMEGLLD